MINSIAQMFVGLGEHFALVAVGCIEVLLAVFLLVQLFAGKRRRRREKVVRSRGAERTFLEVSARRRDEVCICLRRSDLFPVYVTGDMEKLLGVREEQLRENIMVLQSVPASEEEGKRFWKAYRSWNGSEPFADQFQLKNGQWVRLTAVRSEDGSCDLLFYAQATEVYQQIEAYEKRLQEAEEASRSKTTFLSRMSHEIRTPMNGIIGMLSLAEGKVEPDHPVMQYLLKAEELSGHMLHLLNDILDMSRIEAGKVELEKAPFSLRKLGERLYDMFAKTLDARGIRYEIIYEELSVDWVIGDELRISQIIINFLSNAVKFTEKGEITVTFRQMMLHENVVDLLVRVHDTGIGMEPEFLSHIFNPFEQENAKIAQKYGGSGLGMAITEQLVKLMDGEIVVESLPGEGSDFFVYFSLPLTEAQEDAPVSEAVPEETPEEEAAKAKEAEEAFRGCHILLAEDNEINASIATEILGEMGAAVDVAVDGQQAVDAFASHPENYYDVILMDVQMPVLDGRAATKKIRALHRKDAASVYIFALSADAFVEDVRQSVDAGMNGHYAKPVDFVALQHDIGNLLCRKG